MASRSLQFPTPPPLSSGARWNILLLLLSASFFLCYAAKGEEEPCFVYVYATHKTGSTFISHLLHRLGRIRHSCVLSDNTDVETGIAEVLPATAMALRTTCPSGGFVMTRGPTNHPATAEIRIAERLSKASAPGRCLSIFQTRDPRDVAVSQFNAFTTANSYISTKKDREAVLAARNREHEKGIDEYAIHNWPHILRRYEAPFIAEGIHQQYCDTFISEYSDMVHRPELWGGKCAIVALTLLHAPWFQLLLTRSCSRRVMINGHCICNHHPSSQQAYSQSTSDWSPTGPTFHRQ